MLYHWYFVWQFEPTATLFLQIDSINSLGIHRFAVLFYYLRDCPRNGQQGIILQKVPIRGSPPTGQGGESWILE